MVDCYFYYWGNCGCKVAVNCKKKSGDRKNLMYNKMITIPIKYGKAIKLAGLLMLTFIFFSCKLDNETYVSNEYSVGLLSYGDYSDSELKKLQSDIQNCFDTLIPEIAVNVELLGNNHIPNNCWNANHHRLRADSLLRYQSGLLADKSAYILGVTSKDISSSVHGIDDWGILGLSRRPGRTAVVSNYRVSNKQLLYKVAVHELLHSFGLPHCGNKDRSCYICDADKRPQLEKQTRLCPECKSRLLGRMPN